MHPSSEKQKDAHFRGGASFGNERRCSLTALYAPFLPPSSENLSKKANEATKNRFYRRRFFVDYCQKFHKHKNWGLTIPPAGV